MFNKTMFLLLHLNNLQRYTKYRGSIYTWQIIFKLWKHRIYTEKNVEGDQKTMLIYLPPFMFILLSNNNAEYDSNISYNMEIVIQSKF